MPAAEVYPLSLHDALPIFDDLGDDGVGVVGIAVVAAVDGRPPDLLAKRPVGAEAQYRLHRRTGVADRIGAGRKPLGLGDGRREIGRAAWRERVERSVAAVP